MTKASQTKGLLNGVVLTLLPVILFQSLLFAVLSPIPLIVAYFRYPKTWFYGIVAISVFLMAATSSKIGFVLYVGGPLLLVLLFCGLYKSKTSIERIIGLPVILFVGLYLGGITGVSQGHPYAYTKQQLSQALHQLPSWWEQNQAQLKEIKQSYPAQYTYWQNQVISISGRADELSETLIHKKILGFIISGLMLLFWLTTILLKSFRIHLTSTNLKRWKLPDQCVWLFIVSFALNEISVPLLSPLFSNLFVILLALYFLQGISIATFYTAKKKFSVFGKTLIYSALVVFPLFTATLGFFDLWINFRNRMIGGKKTYESHS